MTIGLKYHFWENQIKNLITVSVTTMAHSLTEIDFDQTKAPCHQDTKTNGNILFFLFFINFAKSKIKIQKTSSMKKIITLAITALAFLCVQPLTAAKWRAKHVVLIAIDGWGAYSVPKAKIPHIRSLMNAGCYTLKDRSVLPSASAINWASMFMGVGTELHGYTTWGSRTPEIPSRVTNSHGIQPTIFSVMREQNPDADIACLYEWEGIKYLVDTLSLTHHAQANEKKEDQLCQMTENYIKEHKPTLLAVCYDQLDHTGHADGHDTPKYYEKLEQLDGYVGRILQAIKDAGMWDDTVVIMTADHGGINKGHGGITLAEMEIPFIIAGKGIRQGGEFQESMMQYDLAATIAHVFRLKVPQVWVGRPPLQVFK